MKTVKDYALTLLCEVVRYEHADTRETVSAEHPRARTVGRPYADILAAVRREFPDATTSTACLRWYCVKVREGRHDFFGYQLPWRRPRDRSIDGR